MIKILILEPYFGGSHKQFLHGLQKHVPADYLLMTLPARKWKMRMQLSAQYFVEQIKDLPREQRVFDLVLCSSFVDVAVFRALVCSVDNWYNRAKILTYFHENQFSYPQQFPDPSLYQFASINFNTALASDSIAFNSSYNRENFFHGCRKYVKSAKDMDLVALLDSIRKKSLVLYPGLDFSLIDQTRERAKKENKVPVIVWNHRWEHDKNPDQFFCALNYLEEKKLNFKLIVLGESFKDSPACFFKAQKGLADKIIHFGFVASYPRYVELLAQGDLVISTAFHEFYGISIIEAVRAGCVPVLPAELSYPELFEEKFLYSRDSLDTKLAAEVEQYCGNYRLDIQKMTDRFSWAAMKDIYEKWFHSEID